MSEPYLVELNHERDRLIAERLRIDGQLDGIATALRLFEGAQPLGIAETSFSARLGSIKAYVRDLIAEYPEGLSPRNLLNEAARRNRVLNTNTVTSMLSNLVKEGKLKLVDGRYGIPRRVSGALAPGPHPAGTGVAETANGKGGT